MHSEQIDPVAHGRMKETHHATYIALHSATAIASNAMTIHLRITLGSSTGATCRQGMGNALYRLMPMIGERAQECQNAIVLLFSFMSNEAFRKLADFA